MRLAEPVTVLVLLLTSGLTLHAQRPLKDQDVLQFLNLTVSWYRDVAAIEQSPAGSRESLVADGVRQSSTAALRAAFDFARAVAAIPAGSMAESAGEDSRSRNLAEAEARADQRLDQAQAQLDDVNRRLQGAAERARPGLVALRDELSSEIRFARARRDALHTLLGFLNAPAEGNLAPRINDLERSVPEAAAARTKAAAEPARAAAPQDFHPESSGIVSLITEIFTVYRKMSRLGRLAGDTDTLRQANETLRQPLRGALQDVIRRGDAIAQAPATTDPTELTAQRKELDVLLARFKQLSGASAPLSEQAAQIGASRGGMLEWRSVLEGDYRGALRYLLLRAGALAVGLVVIFAFSELWRRAILRYVRDLRRRRQFLLLRRIVIGCVVALFVVLSFVTEFGSLATFAGFSAAGIAIAMQSVILSVVAYFFLVGRWGVRAGDRVTVAGVTGEVVDVGLFRLYLMELGGAGPALNATGRIVVFPNAVFFQPSALFKQLPGIEYAWRAVTLTLAAHTDYGAVERRLLAAIEAVYGEYRETVERQYRAAQSSMDLTAAPPRPESRVRFAESGLDITIRYPVEIRRAAEIDDRITRELIREIEKEPKLEFAGGGPPKIQSQAG